MAEFLGIFIVQLIGVSILIPLIALTPAFLLVLILKKQVQKKKISLYLYRLIGISLVIFLLISSVSIFLMLTRFFKNESRQAIFSLRNAMNNCDGMTVQYSFHEPANSDVYAIRDPNNIEKLRKAIIESNYKIRSVLCIPYASDRMHINVLQASARNLYFELIPGGAELFGERIFVRYKSSDKDLFDRIYKVLKENTLFYKDHIYIDSKVAALLEKNSEAQEQK